MKDKKKQKIIAFCCVALYVVVSALVVVYIGRPFLKFIDEPERFREFVAAHGVLGYLVYFAMCAMQVFVAAIPGEPLEIAAGYAFGTVRGTLLCYLGIAAGEALVFAFVRKFGMRAVEIFFDREKIDALPIIRSPEKLQRAIFIVFLIPGTPKDILTYAAGLTKISMRDFLVISMLARIPSVFSSTIGGSALGDGNYVRAAVIFGVTAALSIAGIWLYSIIEKRKKK